jgi:hypothetical protein
MSSKKKTSKESRILSLKAKERNSRSKEVLSSKLYFSIDAWTKKDLARIWKVPKPKSLKVTIKLPTTQVTNWITDPSDLKEIILNVVQQDIKVEKELLRLVS